MKYIVSLSMLLMFWLGMHTQNRITDQYEKGYKTSMMLLDRCVERLPGIYVNCNGVCV